MIRLNKPFLLGVCSLLLGAVPLHAGTVVLQEGVADNLLGVYNGTEDNTIHSAAPTVIQPPDSIALNVGNGLAGPRGALVRFQMTDPILDHLAGSVTSADLTVHTLQTSATADQDTLFSYGAPTFANADWVESQVNFQHKNAATMAPWVPGPGGPAVGATSFKFVRAAEMNSTGTPMRFDVAPAVAGLWINQQGGNGGIYYWSTDTDNGGVNMDDNFQVHSSEHGTASRRPALTLRYNTPYTRAVFDSADLLFNNGDGFKNFDNSNRTLTWGEAYILRSYTQMYRATGDTFYLDKLIDHADAVMANRDDFASFPHEVPGNNPTWSSATDGLVSAPLTSGHILQGMVQFARIVNEDAALSANPTYSAKAAEYVTRAQESIDYFGAWLIDLGAEKHYTTEPGMTRLDAANTDGVMGSLLFDQYQATGNNGLLTIATGLAQTIETQGLFTTGGGNLAWAYQYNGPGDVEDISHGAHVAPFIASMTNFGQVFSTAQGKLLAEALIEEAFIPGGQVTAGMNGSSSPEARIGSDEFNWSWGMAGGLIDLAQYDLRLLPLVEAVQLRQYGLSPQGVTWPMLGIAHLVRYANVPQSMQVEITADDGQNTWTTGTIHVGLTGPTTVSIISDAGDVRVLTLEFGGGGDEWQKLWELSLDVDATAAALLAGSALTIDLSLIDGNGDLKQILGTSSVPAGFGSVVSAGGDVLSLSGSLQSLMSFLVDANENLAVPVTLLLGDANNDGVVTADDLIAVQQNFGAAGPPNDGTLLGDANDDGVVTADDLITVQQNFGASLGPGPASVPEPATAIAVLSAFCSALRRSPRR